MEVMQLQLGYIKYAESLFNEGYLDDQFIQLQKLQDASDPKFVVEIISMYFEALGKILNDLSRTMDQQPVDFKKLDVYILNIKGNSSSIGAQRVAKACIAFRSSYLEQNSEACMRFAAQVKQEYAIVKEKLQNLLGMEQRIVEAGGAVPVLNS